MLILQLLNQYEGIAKAAFFGCSAKLNKSIKTNIIKILLLIVCIPDFERKYQEVLNEISDAIAEIKQSL